MRTSSIPRDGKLDAGKQGGRQGGRKQQPEPNPIAGDAITQKGSRGRQEPGHPACTSGKWPQDALPLF